MTSKHFSTEQTVVLTTDDTSPEIDIGGFTSGQIHIPTAETYVTLTYYTASPSGTLYAAQNATPAAITQTVAADKSYPIPTQLFGANRIQIRANVAGNIRVTLKT